MGRYKFEIVYIAIYRAGGACADIQRMRIRRGPCVDGGGGGDKDDEEVFIWRKIDFAKNLQCSETQLGAFIHGMVNDGTYTLLDSVAAQYTVPMLRVRHLYVMLRVRPCHAMSPNRTAAVEVCNC